MTTIMLSTRAYARSTIYLLSTAISESWLSTRAYARSTILPSSSDGTSNAFFQLVRMHEVQSEQAPKSLMDAQSFQLVRMHEVQFLMLIKPPAV